MTLYAIISEDAPGSTEKRAGARDKHRERLLKMVAEGRVFAAGALPPGDSPEPGPDGMFGSLIVAEFGSLAEATAWAHSDPFTLAGVYSRITVKLFRKSMP